jgi:hypothetical protein
MAYSFKLIEAKTLSSNAASVTFTSIPNTYTDLQVLCSVRLDDAGSAANFRMRVNGSSSNYTNKRLLGAGSGSPGSDNQPDIGTWYGIGIAPGNSATSNTFSNISVYLPNYTSSNYKSISVDSVSENNATQAFAVLSAGLWSDTAAITSVTLICGDVDILSGSTFYLYGIKNS